MISDERLEWNRHWMYVLACNALVGSKSVLALWGLARERMLLLAVRSIIAFSIVSVGRRAKPDGT